MEEIVEFLVENPAVLEKLLNGTVSLVGISGIELDAIIEVFTKNTKSINSYLWQ